MRSRSTKSPRSAALLAVDEALRESLALLLHEAGVSPVTFGDPDALLREVRLNEEFIFLDAAQPRSLGLLSELRTRGWVGTAVIMTEGVIRFENAISNDRTRILEKPFTSDAVLSITRG